LLVGAGFFIFVLLFVSRDMKLAVSRSRPSVQCGANFSSVLANVLAVMQEVAVIGRPEIWSCLSTQTINVHYRHCSA